jgi:hypothetical protein
MYGVYAVVMKKRIGNEDRVNMPLFFGLVGLFNVVFLWPGFVILHFTGVETFEIPPTGKIWTIILVCCLSLLFFADTNDHRRIHFHHSSLIIAGRELFACSLARSYIDIPIDMRCCSLLHSWSQLVCL